jgi:hypothetical protein
VASDSQINRKSQHSRMQFRQNSGVRHKLHTKAVSSFPASGEFRSIFRIGENVSCEQAGTSAMAGH